MSTPYCHGAIVSKPIAARWVLQHVSQRWADLIEHALAWRDGAAFDDLNGTLAFIRFAVERSRQQRALMEKPYEQRFVAE